MKEIEQELKRIMEFLSSDKFTPYHKIVIDSDKAILIVSQEQIIND